jgi:hypothetical protein
VPQLSEDRISAAVVIGHSSPLHHVEDEATSDTLARGSNDFLHLIETGQGYRAKLQAVGPDREKIELLGMDYLIASPCVTESNGPWLPHVAGSCRRQTLPPRSSQGFHDAKVRNESVAFLKGTEGVEL